MCVSAKAALLSQPGVRLHWTPSTSVVQTPLQASRFSSETCQRCPQNTPRPGASSWVGLGSPPLPSPPLLCPTSSCSWCCLAAAELGIVASLGCVVSEVRGTELGRGSGRENRKLRGKAVCDPFAAAAFLRSKASNLNGIVMVERTTTSDQYFPAMQNFVVLELGMTLLPVANQEEASQLIIQLVSAASCTTGETPVRLKTYHCCL